MGIQIRVAKSEDADSIFQMVLDLLECSKMKAEDITITAQDLKENAFGERKSFDTFVAEETTAEGRKHLVGLLTYSLLYNCMKGRSLHMEVLYVAPAYRSRGIGRLLMQALAKVAMQDRCVAIDWECLGWNNAGMSFYKRGGAVDVTVDKQYHYMMLEQSHIEKMAE